jgi:secreted trypsin-like serine protease
LHQCGGSIINEWQVITAAHCFTRYPNISEWLIVAGKDNVRMQYYDIPDSVHRIKELYSHEKYVKNGHSNDIAIITVDKPFDLSDPKIDKVDLEGPEHVPKGIFLHKSKQD